MLRATLKSLLSRKLRLTLSALAVVLGVMFVSGAFVLTDSLGKSFDNLFQTIDKSVDVQVTAKPQLAADRSGPPAAVDTVPASILSKITSVPGVRKATGGVFGDGARLIGKNGKVIQVFGAPQFGTSWDPASTLAQIRTGRGPEAADEIAVDAGLAKTSGYAVGDSVGVLTLQPKKTFKLVGIFGYVGNRDTLGGSQTIAFTLPVAQELLAGQRDVFTQINVQAAPGVTSTVLRDHVKDALGTTYQVRTGKEVADATSAGIKQGLTFFNYILLGFAGVALFVGIFLILNTFSMLVAQRTRELALMRAIGASRPQVISSVLIEASMIGVIASVLGLVAGIGIGAGLAYLFSKAGNGGLEISIAVPASAVIASFTLGIGVTLVSAVIPAIRASRIPPIAAMREVAGRDKPLTVLSVSGAFVTVAGGGMLAFALAGKAGDATVWWLIGGVMLAFVGVALLTPLISRPIVSGLGRLMAWGVPGRLGKLNSARNPRRTAITAAALMVSIALVTGISTILSSAKASIAAEVNKTVQADLVISGQQRGPVPPHFANSALMATGKVAGVEAVAGLYQSPAVIYAQAGTSAPGDRTDIVAVSDLSAAAHLLGLTAASGTLSALSDHEVTVDENTATTNKLHVGSAVQIQLPRGGKQTYTLASIYSKNDTIRGFLAPPAAAKDMANPDPTLGLIELASGANLKAVQSQIATLVADSPEVNVQDRSEYVKQTSSIFDTILTWIQVLLALAMVIAVLGIINTLALSVIERTRELGMLRAIGLRRSQTMRMITVESIVISLFGAILGIGVGVGLGSAVVRALKDKGFRTMALPWADMRNYLVAAAIVGVVAAVLPAIRAARLNILSAIAYE